MILIILTNPTTPHKTLVINLILSVPNIRAIKNKTIFKKMLFFYLFCFFYFFFICRGIQKRVISPAGRGQTRLPNDVNRRLAKLTAPANRPFKETAATVTRAMRRRDVMLTRCELNLM
ncbi:hypothetical protein HPP92_000477 [Vanilla planifolia]|uniref:Uncharacterized protein n=1 Tax=Vanilla planifolia TaxID=51239 RepID=A0A835RXJ3_VANPL|nr:hypothetical protein HPP92_000477 [Vanilla planifolia]